MEFSLHSPVNPLQTQGFFFGSLINNYMVNKIKITAQITLYNL